MRRFSFVTLAALALFAAGCGGGGSTCPIIPPTDQTITQGRVIDFDSGKPLDSQTELYFYPVTAEYDLLTVPSNGIMVPVDDDGNYRTTSVPAGDWGIFAVRAGYQPLDAGPFEIVADTTNTLPDLELVPIRQTITQGSVIDFSDDEPLDSSTELTFYPYLGETAGIIVPQNGIDVPVDDNGNYRTNAVPAGEWMVYVTHPGYHPLDAGPYTIVADIVNTLPDLALAPIDPTITQGLVSDGEEPLDVLTELYFYPFTDSSPTIEIPENGIQIPVDSNGEYRTDLVPAGQWNVRAYRVGYEQLDAGPFIIDPETTNTLPDLVLLPLPVPSYITSASCAICHPTQYSIFRNSGHPYKINQVVNDQAPTYPFSMLPTNIISMITGASNTLGAPGSWADLTYVIGGYHWKARFMDADGYIVTGTAVQYNFETDEMVAYDAGVVDKPFNCGNCHTTGWQHTDANLNPNNQDNLPGITGTWAEPGIQCEACHGSGATHARTMSKDDIVRIAPGRTTVEMQQPAMGYGLAVACKECHTRDGEMDWRGENDANNFVSNYKLWAGDNAIGQWGGRIQSSGGLIQHHEQYDEILGIDPDDPTFGSAHSSAYLSNHGDCLTCHRPHQTTVNQDKSGDSSGVLFWDPTATQPYKAGCIRCHSDYDPVNRTGGMKGLDCVDCHMPLLAKSAVSHAAVGDGPVTGDIATHIFSIELFDDAPQFTEDGKFSYPWITADWACRTCHNGTVAFSLGSTSSFVFHNNVKAQQD